MFKQIIQKHFTTINSTNLWAKEHLKQLSREVVTVISADEMTAGYGKYQRRWIAPKEKNLYATFTFFLDHLPPAIGNLTQLMALSAVTLLKKYHLHPVIKWPNDLLINNQKVSGVLCEVEKVEESYGIILGIGININMERELLNQIDQPATSILAETGEKIAPRKVQEELEKIFLIHLNQFLSEGFSPFFKHFKDSFAITLGEEITIKDRDQKVTGTLSSINENGSLTVEIEGANHTFFSGELVD